MNIQEAITKAGEGGKIRRPSFAERSYIRLGNFGSAVLEYAWSSGEIEEYAIGIENLLAEDWEVVMPEVVAPDIEVGDTVYCKTTGPNHPTKVLAIYEGSAWIQYDSGKVVEHYIDNLTFVSRGAKVHKIKGITFREWGVKECATIKGNLASIPCSRLDEREFVRFCDNGKFYTVTLTEETE